MVFYRVKYWDRYGDKRIVWRGQRQAAISVGELLSKSGKIKLSTVVEIEIVKVEPDKASVLAFLNKYATHGDRGLL